jgi:hypothetical protein
VFAKPITPSPPIDGRAGEGSTCSCSGCALRESLGLRLSGGYPPAPYRTGAWKTYRAGSRGLYELKATLGGLFGPQLPCFMSPVVKLHHDPLPPWWAGRIGTRYRSEECVLRVAEHRTDVRHRATDDRSPVGVKNDRAVDVEKGTGIDENRSSGRDEDARLRVERPLPREIHVQALAVTGRRGNVGAGENLPTVAKGEDAKDVCLGTTVTGNPPSPARC